MNVIRWVGSKRNSAINIVDKFNTLPKTPNRYFEPMCGGMSVAILYNHPNTFVCDINYDLINLYHVIGDDDSRNEMFELFSKFENSKDFFYQARDTFNSMDRTFDTDTQMSVPCAAFYYYLVNFSFRGVARYNRKGNLNTPYGDTVATPKEYAILQTPALESLARKMANWVVTCDDYEHMCKDCTEGDLIYLDPPYGGAIPYLNKFDDMELAKLIANIRKWNDKGVHLAISYDKADLGERLGGDFSAIELNTQYRFSNRIAREYLFTNF